jgi:hypothetical protein
MGAGSMPAAWAWAWAMRGRGRRAAPLCGSLRVRGPGPAMQAPTAGRRTPKRAGHTGGAGLMMPPPSRSAGSAAARGATASCPPLRSAAAAAAAAPPAATSSIVCWLRGAAAAAIEVSESTTAITNVARGPGGWLWAILIEVGLMMSPVECGSPKQRYEFSQLRRHSILDKVKTHRHACRKGAAGRAPRPDVVCRCCRRAPTPLGRRQRRAALPRCCPGKPPSPPEALKAMPQQHPHPPPAPKGSWGWIEQARRGHRREANGYCLARTHARAQKERDSSDYRIACLGVPK